MTLSNKRNYKVAISAELNSSHMRPVNFVFNTGVETRLLRGDMAQLHWMKSIGVSKKPRLRRVTIQKVEVVCTIMLYVRMGGTLVRVLAGIVKKLAVSVLFGTYFITEFVKGIFLAKKMIISYRSQSKPILMVQRC